jgi:hypothetical protein
VTGRDATTGRATTGRATTGRATTGRVVTIAAMIGADRRRGVTPPRR